MCKSTVIPKVVLVSQAVLLSPSWTKQKRVDLSSSYFMGNKLRVIKLTHYKRNKIRLQK